MTFKLLSIFLSFFYRIWHLPSFIQFPGFKVCFCNISYNGFFCCQSLLSQLFIRKKYLILIFFIAFLSGIVSSYSQETEKKKGSSIHLIPSNYQFQLPAYDLKERFGYNSQINLGYFYKFRNGFLIGIDGGFIFGDQVKEDSLFKNISNTNGFVLDKNGNEIQIKLFERGFTGFIKVGKLIPLRSINANSGILITAGLGGVRNKIKIEPPKQNIPPQLSDEHLKGYDRLRSGMAINEFIGFLYMSPNHLYNIVAGFDFSQAYTESRRSWQFDLERKVTGKDLELLNGFRVGIILPIYITDDDSYYTD